LLEAMQEQQVTIEGNTLQLPDPFMVLATQNPIEQEGVYRLPEAQLDRFLFRVLVDYPGRNAEIDMLRLHGHPVALPSAVTSIEEIVRLRSVVNDVHVADELNGYTIDLILATRAHSDLALGGSPRAAISLMRAAKAHALLSGRMFLTHEDIQSVAEPVLGHRLIIRPEAEMDGQTTSNVIADCVRSVPVLIDQSRQA
jgi:MoxR-like ATPase